MILVIICASLFVIGGIIWAIDSITHYCLLPNTLSEFGAATCFIGAFSFIALILTIIISQGSFMEEAEELQEQYKLLILIDEEDRDPIEWGYLAYSYNATIKEHREKTSSPWINWMYSKKIAALPLITANSSDKIIEETG